MPPHGVLCFSGVDPSLGLELDPVFLELNLDHGAAFSPSRFWLWIFRGKEGVGGGEGRRSKMKLKRGFPSWSSSMLRSLRCHTHTRTHTQIHRPLRRSQVDTTSTVGNRDRACCKECLRDRNRPSCCPYWWTLLFNPDTAQHSTAPTPPPTQTPQASFPPVSQGGRCPDLLL